MEQKKKKHHLQLLFCQAQRCCLETAFTWLRRRHHLFYCTSISRSTPPRLLLPFLTANIESYHKPWATSRVHQQQWTSVLHPPTDDSGILTRVGDLHPLYWTEATETQYTSSVDSLLSCFENTWLDGEQFSPALWSVSEQDWNRTNNHLEGWHRKFNA